MTDESRQPTAPFPAQPTPPPAQRPVSEPGAPASAGPPNETARARLSRERDERLMHHGRKRREKRQTVRKRRQTIVAIVGGIAVAVLVLSFGVFLWRAADANSPVEVAGESSGAKGGILGRALAKTSGSDIADLAKAGIKREPDPLPTFASWHGLKLHIPVPPKQITEIGFHQAARDYALHLHTGLKVYPTEKLRKTRSTGAHTVHGSGDAKKLGGYYVRMWRARPGAPDSAVDVGASPGTPVYAPVNGTVVKVRHYKLYGKLVDWEMHIRPDDMPNTDLVVIHIDKPKVEIGQKVVAGKTRIAVVRRISGVIDSQLKDFTHTGGDHVHIQLNNAERRDYKGLRLGDTAGLEPYRGPEE